jgi:hypothetical protein
MPSDGGSQEGNLFVNFTRALKIDQQRLIALESRIAGVLVQLSTLELARPRDFGSRSSPPGRSTASYAPLTGCRPSGKR